MFSLALLLPRLFLLLLPRLQPLRGRLLLYMHVSRHMRAVYAYALSFYLSTQFLGLPVYVYCVPLRSIAVQVLRLTPSPPHLMGLRNTTHSPLLCQAMGGVAMCPIGHRRGRGHRRPLVAFASIAIGQCYFGGRGGGANLEEVFRLNKGKQRPSVAPGSSRRPRLSMERDLDQMVVELEDQKAKNVECDRALDEMKDYYNVELAKLRALVKELESALVRESQRITDYIQHTLETRSNTPGGVPDGSVAAAST
ncbi:hypothetical protein BDV93DRAFT_516556 [Ceratobasidium sp. AG-I]|nr:hypothetical protein BDV93DRAFT_516556 [Ceratobasidium sp. AG-I]